VGCIRASYVLFRSGQARQASRGELFYGELMLGKLRLGWAGMAGYVKSRSGR